jgi:hypothetical protein
VFHYGNIPSYSKPIPNIDNELVQEFKLVGRARKDDDTFKLKLGRETKKLDWDEFLDAKLNKAGEIDDSCVGWFNWKENEPHSNLTICDFLT